MGNFDGAEICELLGCMILSQLNNLFRDDGLPIFIEIPRKIEMIIKNILKIFPDDGFKVTIETSKIVFDFFVCELQLKR